MEMTNNLDIGDYMDIVTTYKCRFCSFTSSAPQGISEHVKQVHIQQPVQKQTETIQINDKKVPIDSTLTVDMATGCVQIHPISESNIENNKVTVETEQSSIASYDNMLESLDELSSATTTQESSTDPSSQENVTFISINELSSEQQVVSFANEINQGNSSFDVEGVQGVPSQNIEKMDAQLDQDTVEINRVTESDGSTQTNINDHSEVTLEIQPFQSDSTSKNTPPITKELFLCGQCSIGYNSIEDCKAHMVEDHNIQIEDPVGSNIKISVGTQVENTGKKPGRKKKSEIAENELVEDEKIQPLSDSDWEEDKEDFYIGSRSRRKIRRPKALKDNYYLPKRKKNESSSESVSNSTSTVRQKKHVSLTEKGEEKCHVIGCYAKFKTKESLEIHTKCHMENETTFLCPNCSEIFPNWRLLRVHLWKFHKIDTDLLQCDVCHEFRTDAISKLLIHKEIHSDERPYTCDVCGKGFRQYSQMKNHQIIHNSDDQTDDKSRGKHQCDICKRMFANRKCLLKHIEGVHSKLKPFECRYCGYASSRKAMLQLHERTHTKEKPFKCDVCSFATGDHNSLRRHTMRHTGQRPYRCSYCPYTCIQAISIKMHMKNKHPNAEGIFCCNECTYRTVNEQFFLNHMEDHKNGLITEKDHNNAGTIHIMSDNGLNLQEIIGIQGKSGGIDQGQPPLDLQLQIQTLDSGETHISAEDFARISSYEDLSQSSITSGQLMTYALNAISQNSGVINSSIQIVNGIQISVNSFPPKDGITNHTVRFHVPGPDSFQTADSQVILEQVNQITEVPVQTLSFDDVTETEGISQNTVNDQQIFVTQQGDIVNLVSSATIDDLAQISCIVKDGIIFENNSNNGCSINETNS